MEECAGDQNPTDDIKKKKTPQLYPSIAIVLQNLPFPYMPKGCLSGMMEDDTEHRSTPAESYVYQAHGCLFTEFNWYWLGDQYV